MNLAPQSCPQCGSPLQVTTDGQVGTCPNCRTTFTLHVDVRVNNLASLVHSGVEYLRQGDFPNAEEQSRKIIDLDATRGEGWLLKAATTFDIAQADQAFATGLRSIGEAERQGFALLFKPLALFVWKKATQMLIREAGRAGTSRAAKQHYEIKAKAAQLSAFAIELFPLSGWREELNKYLPIKAWDEYTKAEKIELFDILTTFDSKAAFDLTAFITQRERLLSSLEEKLPEEYAVLIGQAEDGGSVSTQPAVRPGAVAPRARAKLGCCGWIAAAFVLTLLVGIVGSLISGDGDEASKSGQKHRHRSPHEFGWAMGRELLRSATTDSGSGGMVIFAQGCRAENPTVKAYTSAEYQQFLNGLMDAYTEWRRNGYTVLDTEIRDRVPSMVTPANAPAATPTPVPVPPAVAQAPEESPSKMTSDAVVAEEKQLTTPQQTSSQHWLTYGQDVTLHGTLLKQYHTEYLDTLPNSAEGRRRAKTPAYILRLAGPVSVQAADPEDAAFDPEQDAREVYVSATPEGSEKLMDALVGRQVALSGKLDHAYNVHHPRPVMIDATAITGEQHEETRPAASPSAGLQKWLPNGAVADPYANYAAARPQPAQTPMPAPAVLSRVYTVPELKKLVGSRPAGAGLRGDFVLVRTEGNKVLLQSRMELRSFGITSYTNGQEDIYRGHTFVVVTCSKDIAPLIHGQLVTISAEQPLRIISVNKNSQDRIDVEASF